MNLSRKNQVFIAAIVYIIIVFSFIAFSFDRLQQDDYYHIKYSQMMREEGIQKRMPSMEYTIHNENFYDAHFLFHVLIIPFTFGNLMVGAKLAVIFFIFLLAAVFYKFLEYNKIRHPEFWTLALALGSSFFATRLIQVRPISLSVIFWIAGLHFIFTKKYKWLAALSFVYVYTYNTFPFLILIAFVYTACFFAYYKKIDCNPLAYTIIGAAAGLVLNPYFPSNISAIITQYSVTLFRGSVGINLEFSPISTWSALTNLALVFLLLFLVALAAFTKKEKFRFKTVFLFIMASISLVLFFKVQRAIDQFVPFAVLFIAFAYKDLKLKLSKNVKAIFLIAVIGFSIYCAYSTVDLLKVQGFVDQVNYEGCAGWLAENTPRGSRIFILDYGTYPHVYFYNPYGRYTLGLDPIFMKQYDENLFYLYEDAVYMRKDPYQIIKGVFKSDYIFINKIPKFTNFHIYLAGNPGNFTQKYDDTACEVYEVLG